MKIDHGLDEYGWSNADDTQDHAYTFPAIASLLPSASGKGMSILDAGCGNGNIAGRLAALGYQVVEIDLSGDGIEIAKKAHPKVRFAVASVYDDLGSIVEPVDVIASSEVIEYLLYYPQRYLNNMKAYAQARRGSHPDNALSWLFKEPGFECV